LIPYAIVKAVAIELKPVGPSLALILTLILFSVVHLIVAHATMKRLQRRLNMGLSGFDSPWDEEDWVMDSSKTADAIHELFLTRKLFRCRMTTTVQLWILRLPFCLFMDLEVVCLRGGIS